jgi:hypothetical protein
MKQLIQAEHYVEISVCLLRNQANTMTMSEKLPLTVVSIVVYQLLESAGVFQL